MLVSVNFKILLLNILSFILKIVGGGIYFNSIASNYE